MTTTVDRTYTAPEIAAHLGMRHHSVWRWVRALGYPGPGSGRPIHFDEATARTLIAWSKMDGPQGYDYGHINTARRMQVAAVLRARPRRYVVLLGPTRAWTTDDPTEACDRAMTDGRPHVRTIIDTGPLPGECDTCG